MHSLAGLTEFSQWHRCSSWGWRTLFQLPRVWSAVCDKVLNAQNRAPIEIHRQLCQVYDLTSWASRWCIAGSDNFTADWQHVYGEECSGRPSFITDDLVEFVREPRAQWFIFLHLKKFLFGERQRFQNDRETQMSITQWFQSQ